MRKTVVLGLVGTTLDARGKAGRWDHWRPTVDLCRHDDLVVHRLELLHPRRFTSLVDTVEEDIRLVSPETLVRRHRFEPRDPWDFEEVYAALHDFARGYAFAEDEDYLVHITTGTHVAQICLFLLAESRRIPGRLVQTSPPHTREKNKPGRYQLIDLDLRRYNQLARRFRVEQETSLSFLKDGIATKSRTFNALMEKLEQVAVSSKAPLLLTGPTGAGKTRLARRIYELKRARRQLQGRFVEVNCATLRGDGAMSTLFGHKKGSFTGSVADRAGLLLAADHGVLFLDEVGELGLDEQAMLLRAIEERAFLPVGSDVEVTSSFQLVCGTNRDLRQAVRAGTFRDDLMARIDLWTFALPSLAARPEDMEPNLDHELARFAAAENVRVTFNKEARAAYLKFATAATSTWPGNFRELGASVTRMATLARGARIDLPVVEDEVARLTQSWRPHDLQDAGADVLEAVLAPLRIADFDRFDRVQLADVVTVCSNARSLSDAGRLLFAQSRALRTTTNDADRLRKYLAKFGLTFELVAASSASASGGPTLKKPR